MIFKKFSFIRFTFLLLSIFFLFSCGQSEAELKKQRVEREKIIADSIAQVYEQKMQIVQSEKEKTDSALEIKTIQENDEGDLRLKLLRKERSKYWNYLAINYNTNFKLLRGKHEVKIKITNNATLAIFKDLVLEINCYSKTKKLIKTYQKTVYEYIKPNQSIEKKYKIKFPKDARSVGVSLIGAKPY